MEQDPYERLQEEKRQAFRDSAQEDFKIYEPNNDGLPQVIFRNNTLEAKGNKF